MDRHVTFRFYDVLRTRRNQITFERALSEIFGITPTRNREHQLSENFYLRLENLENVRGAVNGELTRIQRTNFPSEIDGDRRIPLRTSNPLGHAIAFRYIIGSNELGIQYDKRVATPARFMEYVQAMVENANFTLRPKIRENAWETFQNSPARKLSIAVARPNNIGRLDAADDETILSSLGRMANAYEAPSISVTLSVGHSRSSFLSETVKAMVARIRERAATEDIELTKLSVRVKEDGERPEDINLLDDILSVKEMLELTERDPDANYRIIVGALTTAMREWSA